MSGKQHALSGGIMNKKLKDMAILIEFLAGSGLAILFHWVLHYHEAAYIIFGFGVLLSLATYLIREHMEKIRVELCGCYNSAHEITFAIAQITDPECQTKAHELMAAAKRTLVLLQQGFIPLDQSEYYLEGAKCSDQACRHIKAVDPLTAGWGSRGPLLNFYQANLRALKRQVSITRIFVLDRDNLTEPEAQKILLAHYRDGIDVRIAFRDEFPATSEINGRDTDSSCDFAIFDDQAVLDVFVQSGKYFGRKTTQPLETATYLRLFGLIENSAHMVTLDKDRIILAENSLSAGSDQR